MILVSLACADKRSSSDVNNPSKPFMISPAAVPTAATSVSLIPITLPLLYVVELLKYPFQQYFLPYMRVIVLTLDHSSYFTVMLNTG